MGLGDGSIGKARFPQFMFFFFLKTGSGWALLLPALGRWRKADPWSVLLSLPNRLHEFQLSEQSSLKRKQNRTTTKKNNIDGIKAWHLRLSSGLHTHVPAGICIPTNLCAPVHTGTCANNTNELYTLYCDFVWIKYLVCPQNKEILSSRSKLTSSWCSQQGDQQLECAVQW